MIAEVGMIGLREIGDPYEHVARQQAAATAQINRRDAIIADAQNRRAFDAELSRQIAAMMRLRKTPHAARHEDPFDLSVPACYSCGLLVSHPIHASAS